MTLEAAVFFGAWLRKPLQIAAALPSGPAVADGMASLVDLDASGVVLELGAGTGSITRGLLRQGCPADRLVAVERDRVLATHLKETLPTIRVLRGDATALEAMLRAFAIDRIAAVVSSLPIKWFPLEAQRAVVMPCFDRLAPGGRVLQLTNAFASPLRAAELGLSGSEVARVWRNMLPVQIWSYELSRRATT
jgi:phosphatidylethanolamine/phosphatidyl-N-methylethanolamine N-methyltransferase